MIHLSLPHGSTRGGSLRARWDNLAEACRILRRRPDLIPAALAELDRLAEESQAVTARITRDAVDLVQRTARTP